MGLPVGDASKASEAILAEGRISLTLRVPTERFRAVLGAVGALGEVVEQHIGTEDVTAQVVDLESRITSARVSIVRLRELLTRSGDVAQLSTVEGELARSCRRRLVPRGPPMPSPRLGEKRPSAWRSGRRSCSRSSAEFIPVAECNGLIGDLGTAVLRRACTVAAGWHRDHPGSAPSVSVNLSAHQLARRELPELVAAVLRDSGLPATALILEVTESALISDLATMSDRLALIRGLGVRVALDDFGTGYSSMSYLAHLPVDSMKIDRSFLVGIEHDPRTRAIVASVIELAHATGLRVVCEGIETPNEDEIIRALGADMAQGFLYHRPDLQVDAVLKFILDRAELSAINRPAV